MKIYFIVLHYINSKETINCVNSIIDMDFPDKEIIIVDNGSNNGTGEGLEEIYKSNSMVKVIVSKHNLGFAKGNNLGIKNVEDKSDALLVICNSDLIFYKKDFCENIVDLYDKEKYAVLGPEIISEDGIKHEYPTEIEFYNIYELKNEIRKFQVLKELNSLKLVNLSRAIHKLMAKTRRKFPYDRQMDNKKIGIKVHGACFVLSSIFFKKYDGLFDGTFLFQEENLLGHMCKSSDLKVVFNPKPSVIHLGSRSYKVMHHNKKERFCNYIVNNYNSLLSYYKYLETKNENFNSNGYL